MKTPRIVLLGPMGIGKTTAVRALCGDTVVDCDVVNLDTERHSKPTTTVGADFGILRLDTGEELHVYGSPGQSRFDFVLQWLLSFAMGAFVMVDISEPDALRAVKDLLSTIGKQAPNCAAVVLVARPASVDSLDDFACELARVMGEAVPILPVDPRDRTQMTDALQILLATIPDPQDEPEKANEQH